METKKITSVQENQRSYNGKYGQIFIHMIQVEGSETKWEYHSQKQNCDKFKVGEVANFTTETKQNGQYINYIIKPVNDQPGAGNGSGFKKAEQKDQGTITYLSCFSSAANYYAQRSDGPDAVLSLAERAFQEAMKHSTLKP